jgi:copper resistance protein B
VNAGKTSDGDHKVLYDRPIPAFGTLAGIRTDLDSGPSRVWGAAGIEELAPYFFQFEPTFYFRDGAHLAARLSGSYDLLRGRVDGCSMCVGSL